MIPCGNIRQYHESSTQAVSQPEVAGLRSHGIPGGGSAKRRGPPTPLPLGSTPAEGDSADGCEFGAVEVELATPPGRHALLADKPEELCPGGTRWGVSWVWSRANAPAQRRIAPAQIPTAKRQT